MRRRVELFAGVLVECTVYIFHEKRHVHRTNGRADVNCHVICYEPTDGEYSELEASHNYGRQLWLESLACS